MIMRYVLPAINGDNVNRQKSYEMLYRKREEFIGLMMEGTKRAFDKHEAGKASKDGP
jgi:limonene 1,2-monooxygenase